MREWHGVTHTVVILADGVEWRGQRYRSLSVVAREITGAHWSGPRFFGLTALAPMTEAARVEAARKAFADATGALEDATIVAARGRRLRTSRRPADRAIA